jgi:hypothetical protein
MKEGGGFVMAKLLCPRDQRAVARHLVVLDCLSGRDQRGIEHWFLLDLTRDFRRLP